MRVYGQCVFLGVVERRSNGKVYHNVNLDFDGDLRSLYVQDVAPFSSLTKYVECTATLFFGRMMDQNSNTEREYMRLESLVPCK